MPSASDSKTYRLRRLRVKRIDLVDRGASYDAKTGEGAHVMLFKRDLSKMDPDAGDLHTPTMLGGSRRRDAVDKDDDSTDTDTMCRNCGSGVENADNYCKGCGVRFYKGSMLNKAPLEGGQRTELPDSSFAAVWTDADGKKQRKLPIHDASHVRNALARFDAANLPASVRAKAKAKIEAAARRFGVGKSHDGVEGDMEKKVDLSKIADADTRAAVEALISDRDAAVKLAEEEQTKREAAEKAAKAAGADPAGKKKDDPDPVAKGVSPEVAEIIKGLRAELKAAKDSSTEAQEQVAKMRDEELERVFVTKAAGFKSLTGTTPKALGKFMKSVSDKLGAEPLAEFERLLKAWDEQLKVAKLFGERGSLGADSGASDAESVFLNIAKSMVEKKEAPDMAAAMSKAAKEHPEEYEAYRDHVSVKV